MRNLLYPVHRLPYPPNKGDKVRSYHLLRHLAARHRVFLGTFVDDPDDERYIAPLRVARGVQNNVSEAMAMAMARPVVASQACAAGIDAAAGHHLETAADAQGFAASVESLLQNPARATEMGLAARECVLARYSWEARLSRIDRYLESPDQGQASAA